MAIRKIQMFDTTKKIDHLINTIDDLKLAIESVQEDKLEEKLSLFDKRINEIYHRIETGRPDGVQMVKTYKELQCVLRERRQIKNQMSVICAINSMTGAKLIKSSEHLRNIATKAYANTEKEDVA